MALREILDRNRLEQAEVADAIGVSRVSVGNWVNGHGKPRGPNLVRLLDYLRRFEPGLQADDILPAELDVPDPTPAASERS